LLEALWLADSSVKDILTIVSQIDLTDNCVLTCPARSTCFGDFYSQLADILQHSYSGLQASWSWAKGHDLDQALLAWQAGAAAM